MNIYIYIYNISQSHNPIKCYDLVTQLFHYLFDKINILQNQNLYIYMQLLKS